MNFVISIDKNFTNYNFIEDVLDFHTNGNKRSVLCYLELNPFLLTYAQKRGMETKQITLNDLTKSYYAIVLGDNKELLCKCNELKLKKGVIKEEI